MGFEVKQVWATRCFFAVYCIPYPIKKSYRKGINISRETQGLFSDYAIIRSHSAVVSPGKEMRGFANHAIVFIWDENFTAMLE